MKVRPAIILIPALAIAAALWFAAPRSCSAPSRSDLEGPIAEYDDSPTPNTKARSLLPQKFPDRPTEGAPPSEPPVNNRFTMTIEPQPALSGIEFAGATEEDRKNAGVTEQYGRGVTVTRIHPDSSAAEVSMEVGDVIVRAQKENVNSVEDLRRIVGERDHVVVNLMRQGQLLSVVLQKPFVPPTKTP